MKGWLTYILVAASLLLLWGCSVIYPVQQRKAYAGDLARKAGWEESLLSAGLFNFLSFGPKSIEPGATLNIYIEGDGFAWVTATSPSTDPTPVDPVGLKLALADIGGAAVYLGRPCQYVISLSCRQDHWTFSRFSAEIVESMDLAVTQLKQKFKAQSIVLIGYSGGGAVAALIASRRSDVAGLVTVAGNLDHEIWSKMHQVTSLSGSLNPAEQWRSLSRVPQVHFSGIKDVTVPPDIALAFRDRFPRDHQPDIEIIPEADHGCCWDKFWPTLQLRLESLRAPIH